MFNDCKTKSRQCYACRKLLSECHFLFHEIPSRNSRDITKQSLTPRAKKNIYSTWCSQAVTHLSTNHARRCLTSVIGREPVFSTWYGRRHERCWSKLYEPTTQFYMLIVKFSSFQLDCIVLKCLSVTQTIISTNFNACFTLVFMFWS